MLDPVNNLPEDIVAHEVALETAQAKLGETVFNTLWNEALAMTPEQAVAYALSDEA